MFKRLLIGAVCISFMLAYVQNPWAQEEGKQEGDFIIEEELQPEFKTGLTEEELKPQYITAEILSPKDVEPAVNFYIRSDIDRKFSGLITNLKLEKIYGILQENKTATVYFDYSYTSVRNKDNILYEKGKITFMRFNSGRWFNAELSIFLMDSYHVSLKKEQTEKEQ